MYPSGQVHSGSWLITLQIAVGAQGFSSAHGLIHCRFRHAVYRGHSSFSRHPTDKMGSVGNPTTNCVYVQVSDKIGMILEKIEVLKIVTYIKYMQFLDYP